MDKQMITHAHTFITVNCDQCKNLNVCAPYMVIYVCQNLHNVLASMAK